MLKKAGEFEFEESARKVYEFVFGGIPEEIPLQKFEISEGRYKCDAHILIGDLKEIELYSINKKPLYLIDIQIFKSTKDYKDWKSDIQLIKVRVRIPPLAIITLDQKQTKICVAKLYIEEDSNEWLKTRNNPWHISQQMGHQLLLVYWRELIERWDSLMDLNEILSLDNETEKVETDSHPKPSKTWEFLRTIWKDQHQNVLQRRAEVWRLWDDERLSTMEISYRGVSKSAIRRDLLALAKENLLERPYPTQSQSL